MRAAKQERNSLALKAERPTCARFARASKRPRNAQRLPRNTPKSESFCACSGNFRALRRETSGPEIADSTNGDSMAQRIRDLVTGELTLDYFMQRSAAGWKVASIEWVREAPSQTAETLHASATSATTAPIPYGMQIAQSGEYLEENPLEATVLMMILEQIVKEKRISEIAVQLNHQGHRTREGLLWSPTAVFNLLPRLIEAGPSILKSREWSERRVEGIKPN